mgnify:CR=1 FL=1
MLQEERKQYILSLLNAKSSVTVAELSKAFQLSEVSVRKMLMKMEKQGEIKRTWGGAVSVEGSLQEYSHSEKVPKYLKEKLSIAKAAYECRERPLRNTGAALLTLWVKCVSAERGHGSKSRVHFLGYSLAPVGVSVWVRKKWYPKMTTYEKQKSSKSDDFEDFWYAVRDSNPRPSGP